jgi:hypothetical protein
MFPKRMLIVALLLTCATRSAQAQSFLAGGWSCEELKAACADQFTTPDDVYQAGFISGTGGLPYLGTCYVHDRSTCPNCFCWDYVKIAWLSPPRGYNNGTGCVDYPNVPPTAPQSRALAGQILLELCKSGACCCPQIPSDCSFVVRARDLTTGSCCNFCQTVPSGWTTSIGPNDCR